MKQLKDIDYKILFKLMKNARTSDRELARVLGTSQPTVSRKRAFLEKELIDGYTVVPKWEKLGYELLAIILVKSKPAFSSRESYENVRKKGLEWLMNQPNIIAGGAIEGMGFTSFIMSLHKSYPEYNEFMRKLKLDMGELIVDAQTLLIDLTAKNRLKPLNFKYLAEEK